MLTLAGKNWVRNWFLRLGWLTRQKVRLRRRPTCWSVAAPHAAQCGHFGMDCLEARVLLSGITVNSTSGGTNYDPGTVTIADLHPDITAVTLRDAVNAANHTAGLDTITFDASVFPPNPATPTTITLAAGGTLRMTEAVTIDGPGAGAVAVSGNNLSTVFVIDTGVAASISGLTITGGNASVDVGGGLKSGGGLYNSGTLTLQNDVITLNSAGFQGGGLFNAGNVTIIGSTFSSNSAEVGGGFFNSGNATVSSVTLSANSATSSGGGFYSLGTVAVTGSTITANTAAGNGGGFFSNNVVTLTGSTLDHNVADSGGGFYNSGNATVVNSTLAANRAQFGGGLYNIGFNANLNLTDSTVAANFGTSSGGGVDNVVGTVTLSGTIVARNTVSATNSAPSDWSGNVASAVASTYNLIGDGTSTGLTNGLNHNIVGSAVSPVDPLLAPLGNYGGPTRTMALLPGSLAIDAGAAFLNPITGLVIATDQRGTLFARLVGPAVDIGAFEAFIPTVTSIAAPTVTYGQEGFVTVTVAPSNATGTLSLFVDGSSTAVGTHVLTAGDNGRFTFDVGIENAGTHSLHAVYTATGAFLDSSAHGSLVVNKANATIHVAGYSVTYDGNAHTATGSATGVRGESLTGLDLSGTTHTNAGSYAGDTWTFTDTTGNYNNASGTVDDSIAKADATIHVTGYSVTYVGNAHTATGSATGVQGESLTGLDLSGTTHTNAGSYAGDTWTFTDSTGNYNNASGTVDNSIAKANATIHVTGYSVTYDGNAHTATGSATGVQGESLTGLDLSGTTHTNAGSYAGDTWTFTDSTGNYNNASGTVDNSIAKANATIHVTGYSVTYDGNAHTATGSATGVQGESLTGLDLSGTTHTNAGSYAGDTWTFTDSTGNYNNASGTVDDSIAKADATIHVTGYSVTYDGNAHAATGTATGIQGESLIGLNLNGSTHTNAGSYAGDTWTFTDSTGNYNDAGGTVDDSIAKANATIHVTGYSVTYDGNAHIATGTATGVQRESLSGLDLSGTTHTSAGSYLGDHWTFSGGTNYNDASGTVDDSIARANATINVTGYSVTYDGNAHIATGTATGVGGTDLSAGLVLGGTTHTSAGSYAGDAWTFTDSTGNYNDAGGTVDDSIAKANATIHVTGYSVTYDGNAHIATGTATGVQGESLSGLDLSGTTHTNAGSYASDIWTFTDSTGNYNDAGGTVDDSIAKANATIHVTGYSVTYDGNAHTATGTATGVHGESLSGLDLSGTTHTNAGSYAGDIWTFTDSTGNYNDASGTVDDSIAKANAKFNATINVTGYSVTYDGNAHTATGTATGVNGEGLNGLDLSGTTHTNAGHYAGDTWTFTDSTGNYNDASGTVDDSIAKANATIHVTGYSGTYDGVYHGATGSATGVGGADLSARLNLGASFRNVPGGTAHWTFSGGTNYNDAAGNVSIVIGVRTVTGVITANDKVYDGTTTATISGTSLANAIERDDVTLTVGPANFASQNAGTWTVTATGLSLSGADAGNYVLASTTAQTTARILTRSLDAVLSTASTINIARNGWIKFTLSSLNGIVDGQTVADLFDGAQFSLQIGSSLYSGTSTASVVGGTISVSWRMNAELYTDLYALLDGGTPSSKTTIDLKVYATSLDGNYTLSEDVLTKIFQRGNVTFS